MKIRTIPGIRLGWMVAAILAVFTIAACGGSSDQNNADEQSVVSSDREAAGSGGQSSGTSPLSAANPCNAFSLVGGAGPAGGFMSQAFGGPDIDTSGSPQSDFAKEVAKFSEDALEQVFDGNVTAICFFEATMGDEGLVWIAFNLPSAPPSGAGQAVGDAMTAMGATVEGAFSSTTPGGTFDLVGFKSLPAEAPGGALSTGGLYFVTDETGSSLAVMMVGYEEGGEQSKVITSGQEAPSSGGRNDIPAVMPTIVPVVPTGTAATISDQLRPALEDALGVDLLVESFFETSAGGVNSVSLLYVIDGGVPDSAATVPGFTTVVEGLGGTVTFSMAAGSDANVTFDELKIADLSASGSVGLTENKIFITIISTTTGS